MYYSQLHLIYFTGFKFIQQIFHTKIKIDTLLDINARSTLLLK